MAMRVNNDLVESFINEKILLLEKEVIGTNDFLISDTRVSWKDP